MPFGSLAVKRATSRLERLSLQHMAHLVTSEDRRSLCSFIRCTNYVVSTQLITTSAQWRYRN